MRRLVVMALVALGCGRPTPPQPAGSPADGGGASTPTAPAAPPSNEGGAPSKADPAALPPDETACAKDDDCVDERRYLLDGRCCAGTCTPRAVSKTFARKLDAHCAALGESSDSCPTKKCAAFPPVRCVSGQCRMGE
jgi:hypothetical protein